MTTLPPSAAMGAWAPKTQSLLRIVAAMLFLSHGTSKLFNLPPLMPNGATVPLVSWLGLAGTIEIVGGTLLLLGLFTRPVAFITCGEMAVAYFWAHAPGGFWPTVNKGEVAVLFCFIWLYFATAGAGAWSLDAMRARSGGPSR
jgi:putative oxidoreductase